MPFIPSSSKARIVTVRIAPVAAIWRAAALASFRRHPAPASGDAKRSQWCLRRSYAQQRAGDHRPRRAIEKPWTTFADATDGCTCTPSYYVVVRDGTKLHRERVGRNRKLAERSADEAAGRGGRGLVCAAKKDPFRGVGRSLARRARAEAEDGGRLPLDDGLREEHLRVLGCGRASSWRSPGATLISSTP